MKNFLLKSVAFLLPIILFSYPLDYAISYFLKQSNQFPGEYEVMNDIYASKANVEIAIYGSSRAWVHIDPKIISDSLALTSYNFGIDGHNFWLQYLRHLELLKYNQKPKTIVLSVDLFSLKKRIDLYQKDQFLPYMLWNNKVKEYTSSFEGFNNFDYEIPLIRYAGNYKALETSVRMIFNNPDSYRKKGYRGMEKEWNSDLDNAKAKFRSFKIDIDANSLKLFEQFIQECENSEINLIFIYTPEYIEGQNFVSNRKDIIDIYHKLSKKYGVEFLDYSNDKICQNKELFYNASHLTKEGSTIFSKKLAHDLKIIMN